MRSCGSDDFSYYGEQAPILMIFVGTGDGPAGPGLHHPGYLPPERSVADVARSLACATVAALARSSRGVAPWDPSPQSDGEAQ